MSRVLAIIVILGLGIVSVLFTVPVAPAPGAAAAENPPAVAVCRIDEGSGRSTTVGIVSTVNGPGRLTAFAGGTPTGSSPLDTGASASDSIALVDVVAVGVAGALVELPDADSSAGSVVAGATSFSADTCTSRPSSQSLIAGGSTLSGEAFELQLMNPYAGEAVVDLTVTSEAGLESSGELKAIIVPSRSSMILDLAEILPGRERLAILAETVRGSVISTGRFTSGTDSAIWSAVPPAQDWFMPVPVGDGSRHVILSTSSLNETAYQVDVYGSDGLIEAFEEGVIAPLDQVSIDLGAIETEVTAVRVIAAGPIAGFLKVEGPGGLGLTSAAPESATQWLLPGAGLLSDSVTQVIVLNPGTEDATVVITERRQNSNASRMEVRADEVVAFDLIGPPGDGVAVESDVPVVVLWSASRGESSALAVGTPLVDG